MYNKLKLSLTTIELQKWFYNMISDRVMNWMTEMTENYINIINYNRNRNSYAFLLPFCRSAHKWSHMVRSGHSSPTFKPIAIDVAIRPFVGCVWTMSSIVLCCLVLRLIDCLVQMFDILRQKYVIFCSKQWQ